MFGAVIGPALQAFAAGANVWTSERTLYNSPELVKSKLAEHRKQLADRLTELDAILVNPSSTPVQHAEALRRSRLAMS